MAVFQRCNVESNVLFILKSIKYKITLCHPNFSFFFLSNKSALFLYFSLKSLFYLAKDAWFAMMIVKKSGQGRTAIRP